MWSNNIRPSWSDLKSHTDITSVTASIDDHYVFIYLSMCLCFPVRLSESVCLCVFQSAKAPSSSPCCQTGWGVWPWGRRSWRRASARPADSGAGPVDSGPPSAQGPTLQWMPGPLPRTTPPPRLALVGAPPPPPSRPEMGQGRWWGEDGGIKRFDTTALQSGPGVRLGIAAT